MGLGRIYVREVFHDRDATEPKLVLVDARRSYVNNKGETVSEDGEPIGESNTESDDFSPVQDDPTSACALTPSSCTTRSTRNGRDGPGGRRTRKKSSGLCGLPRLDREPSYRRQTKPVP